MAQDVIRIRDEEKEKKGEERDKGKDSIGEGTH